MEELLLALTTTSTTSVSIVAFIICMAVALALGVFMAFMYSYKSKSSESFIVALAILPLTVSMVIMMVNGNIGTGVTVAGAFSLVRFRSAPGTAKEIGAIFIAMCTGLILGMGYIGYAVLFTFIACVFSLILDLSPLGTESDKLRSLRITIPESLNYTDVFDDIFDTYTKSMKLISAKTSNMGSMYKLYYEIELKESMNEKDFIDELRCRNGNLEIMISRHTIDDKAL